MVLYIETKGTARERGFQQGEQLREKIPHTIDFVMRSKMISETVPSWIPIPILKFGLGILGKKNIQKPMEQYLPHQYEKIQGLSESSKLSRNFLYGVHAIEILAGNPKSVYRNPPVQACSMIMASPQATTDHSVILARNYDFPNPLQPFQMVRKEIPSDGYKMICVSQLVWVSCHMGLNEKGLAMCFNFGRSWKQNPLDYRKNGVPSTLVLQQALESCANTQEAIDFIQKFPARTNGGHYGIVDKSGDTCVVETTSTRYAVRRPVDGFMAHTNTYETPELKDANLPYDVHFKMPEMDFSPIESPIRRLKRINILLQQNKAHINFDLMKKILSDHEDRKPDDFTICTHAESAGTLASMIILPQKGEIWVTDNKPCMSAYEKFQI